MAKIGKETKKQELDEAIALAFGAVEELHLELVDFSDLTAPKICLEVDLPILPINNVVAVEKSSGSTRQPIYQEMKRWARRSSTVSRSIPIAAASKAPNEPAEAARLVWDSCYGNHQKNAAFKKLELTDIFMGGGTTDVESSRLGCHMYGNESKKGSFYFFEKVE